MQFCENFDVIFLSILVDFVNIWFILLRLNALEVLEPRSNSLGSIGRHLTKINPVPIACRNSQHFDPVLFHFYKVVLLNFGVEPAEDSVILNVA